VKAIFEFFAHRFFIIEGIISELAPKQLDFMNIFVADYVLSA
jgi:hypothetical protein